MRIIRKLHEIEPEMHIAMKFIPEYGLPRSGLNRVGCNNNNKKMNKYNNYKYNNNNNYKYNNNN